VHSNTNQAEYQARLIKDVMLSNDDGKESRRKKKNKAKVLITFFTCYKNSHSTI
jgi:hypothetical protein